jgi:hypothetical protein
MFRLPKPLRRLIGYDDRVTQRDLDFLRSLRNKHAGQRCFILGNGPSLDLKDIETIRNEVTFASNKIYLFFDQTEWRPTYYSVEDTLVMAQCEKAIRSMTGTVKLLPHHMMHVARRHKSYNIYRYLRASNPSQPLSDPNFPGFSTDSSRGVAWGSTVVYSQIQLAVHMGFSSIALLGLDHDYNVGPLVSPGVHVSVGEQNHFHPDYRRKGEKWHAPNLDVLEVAYAKARKMAEVNNTSIVNCSRRSKLDVFPKMNFETFLSVR